jgi:hypothetical protein
VRAIRRAWDRLRVEWEAGLARLPSFTQRTAVLLLGVLVATLAMLGGVVALVGWPGAGGPTRLVPGERAGQAPASRPEPGNGPAPGARAPGDGDRSGADAGGATAASPSPAADPGGTAAATSPAAAARSVPAGVPGVDRAAGGTAPGGTSPGAQGSGGAAGAGAGGPPAAPPTTSPPATTPPGPLDPVEELLGPVVSTLVP